VQLMSIDLHVHTKRSDGVASPIEMIYFARKKHLDGIAITDHDNPLTEDELELIQEHAYDFIVIPGVEVSAREGHILLLGVFEAPEKGTPIKDVIKFGRKKDAVIIIPHPFDILRKGIGKTIKKIDYDAIEIYNPGSILPIFNNRARSYAIKNNKIPVAGSDAHLPEAIGLAYTIIATTSNKLKSIYDSIRKGRVYPIINNSSFLNTISLKIRRKILRLFK